MVQETFSNVNIEHTWQHEWGGRILYSHGSNHSKGVMILLRNNIKAEIIKYKADYKGRFIVSNMKVNDKNFVLINVYAPNRDNDQINFYADLDKVLDSEIENDSTLILGGDWNVVLDPDKDKRGGSTDSAIKRNVRENVKFLLEKYALSDIWRIKNPKKARFTYRQKTPLIQSRLDYWTISENTADFVEDCEIITSPSPDHSAITLHIKNIPEKNRGPGLWKFNNSLLEDETYVKNIKHNYQAWVDEFTKLTDKRVVWDGLKYKVRQYTIRYSKEKKGSKEMMERY